MSHNKPHYVIKETLLTEKYSPTESRGRQRVAFEVATWASKTQIRSAIESLYSSGNVKVDAVKTFHVKGKPRLTRKGWGRTKDWKKAVVVLKEGSTIDLV